MFIMVLYPSKVGSYNQSNSAFPRQ